MRIMVTGAAGQLGRAVLRTLKARGVNCLGAARPDFDLTDGAAVMRAVQEYQPDAIIHCAAYTAVDRAESDPDACMAVGGMGTLHLVRAALSVGAKLMYISTDYVFPGCGSDPHETNAPLQPLNVYGLSKLQGEEAVRSLMTRYFIVRTSWVFGPGGRSFVETMRRLGREKAVVRVVSDQAGSPTYAEDLAELLADMIGTSRYGVYHATNEGFCTFAELAEEVLRLTGSACRVERITSDQYGAAAKRPLNGRLSKESLDRAGFARLPHWRDALVRYLAQAENEG